MVTNSNQYSYSHANGVDVEGVLSVDKLFDRETLTKKVTIKQGAAHVRGELLGKVTKGAVTSAVKASGANTGNGTFVLDATTPLLANALVGVYQLRCIEAVTNGGKFVLYNPKGYSLGTYIVVAGAGGTITVADHIKGVLTDGSTDFIVGDGFDITVAAPVSDKYVLSLLAAVDGSEEPDAILLHDADATSADIEAVVAYKGRFAIQGMTFGTGQTAANVAATLRAKDMYLENIVG